LGLCARAAIVRDKARGLSDDACAKDSNSWAGIAIAAVAGVLSGMLNVGFVLGEPLQRAAPNAGYAGDLTTAPIWFLALAGGAFPNILYTRYVLKRAAPTTPQRERVGGAVFLLRCFGMACIWFGAIFLYGWGASLWGPGATVYGWAVLNGAGVLGSNLVGIAAGDWHGAPAASLLLMAFATVLQFIAFFILAAA
jgi:L-rhamnose-H+ transport protein